jgi:DNA-binding transcriptional MocR family regulator
MVQLGAIAPGNIYLPSTELSKCMSRVARMNPYEINQDGSTENNGNEGSSLEKTITKYMFHTSGIAVSESEICLSNGAAEGLYFALSTVANQDDVIAVESPCFSGVYCHLQRLRLKPLEIESLPPHGLKVDKLESLLHSGVRPKAVVVTPNFHNPTGSLMPIESRKKLLDLCRKYDMAVIEDDVLGALRFGNRIPSLKELMLEEVIYVSSYSKTLAPGYRVGWLAGGKYTKDIKITQGKQAFDMTLSSHLAVSHYIESGKYKTRLRNLRVIYERNCDQMSELLLKAFPKGTKLFRPSGGQYLWMTMPKSISATSLFLKALKHNIILAPGAMFSEANSYPNCLRFSFALELTSDVTDSIEISGMLAKTL